VERRIVEDSSEESTDPTLTDGGVGRPIRGERISPVSPVMTLDSLCVNKELDVCLYTRVFRLSASGSNYGDQARAGHRS